MRALPADPSRRRCVAALAIGAAGLGGGAARAQFRVEISGVGATQLPLAVAAFAEEEKAPVRVSQVIRANLERSGLFRIIDGGAGLDERSPFEAAAWRGRGADALLAGSLLRLADGRWDLRCRLWDVLKNTELFGRSLVVPAADLRLAAHRLSDEIHERLTGERAAYATRIAYVVRTGSRYTLRVTDADGEGGQVALASNEPIISPSWSPDGRFLAYVSFETQKAVVWLQELQSGERRPLANFRGSNSAPAFSPDGRTLAVTLTREGLSQVFLLNADGSGSPRRLTTSAGIDTEPAFSPDGRGLYFTSDRGGSPQIYRMPAAGGDAVRVTFGSSYNTSPRVSPDGRLLAFLTRRDGRYHVALKDLNSGNETVLTDSGQDEAPSFSPNGQWVMYSTRSRGRETLMAASVDGRVKQRLTSNLGDIREPSWGPFGK